MIVTEIKKIGAGKRYKVFIDNENIGVFQDEILAKYQLKTGQEIDEDFLKQLKKSNSKVSSFDDAVTYLEKFSKTKNGIKDYLRKKGYDNETIENTCKKLDEYGFINDRLYAENYIKTYITKKSKKAIKYELKFKGVNEQIIDELLSEVDDEEEKQTVLLLAKKYTKNKEIDQKTKQKCKNYLFSKGFSYDLCNYAVDSLGGEDEDWF